MIGAAAVLTAVILIYGGYAEGAKQVTAALAALASEALDGDGRRRGADVRRSACPFRPGRDRGVDPPHAQRQSLRRSALDAALASAAEAMARPADLASRCRWPLGVVAIGCAVGVDALPAPASQYFSIVVGGLGAAFALQGLAVAHALSRGLKLRIVMLVALYACCVLRAKYTLPVLAALGLVDAFARLRARAATSSPKPSSHR